MVYSADGLDTSWTVFAFKGSTCNAAQTHERGTDFRNDLVFQTTIAANTPSFSADRGNKHAVYCTPARSNTIRQQESTKAKARFQNPTASEEILGE
jgi:hypothetical protein